MNHLISCEQFTHKYVKKIFSLASGFKEGKPPIKKTTMPTIATIFYEPSTRTRLSFEQAIINLGFNNISTENAKQMSSAVKGESLEDTIKVISGYCHGIVLRHSDDDSSKRASLVSRAPIINAGAGKGEHPTQALLDAFTIYESIGDLNNLKLCISGDLRHGRTIHSLIKLISMFKNVEVYGISRDFFELPTSYIKYMNDRDVKYIPLENFSDLPNDINVIYHTRTQTERFQMSLEVEELIINKKVMEKFSNAIVMHPLPRVNEISTDFDNDPRAKYFEQAHNGVYVRMAILQDLFKNIKGENLLRYNR